MNLTEITRSLLDQENQAIEYTLESATEHGVLVTQPPFGRSITFNDTSNSVTLHLSTVREDPSVPFGEVWYSIQTIEEQA